jgi:hypothetical protein
MRATYASHLMDKCNSYKNIYDIVCSQTDLCFAFFVICFTIVMESKYDPMHK